MKIETSELDSILETVQLYQDGHFYQDAEKLKKAFHPNSQIVGYFEGEAVFDKRDPYVDLISNIPSEGDLKVEKVDETENNQSLKIMSIDMTDTTAVVKIKSTMFGVVYTSFLSMLKLGDEWKIVNGLFHAE